MVCRAFATICGRSPPLAIGISHSPKNLAVAISVEAPELLEHFQWIAEAQSALLAPDKPGYRPAECGQAKDGVQRRRYPINKAKGSSRKYTKL
jgi:hypothetical protein